MTPTSSGSHSLNSLVKGTMIEGTVKASSDIRIDGTIKGNLHCDSKVIIGPTGLIDGEVRCMNAVIEGKFEGTLHVKELLNIRESAVVNGDVTTSKLVVQPGAVFNVTCTMGDGKRPGSRTNSSGHSSSSKSSSNAKAAKVTGAS
ncbi:MAG: polymer-forming cytoskeletal protein [Bacteroidota bacterium]